MCRAYSRFIPVAACIRQSLLSLASDFTCLDMLQFIYLLLVYRHLLAFSLCLLDYHNHNFSLIKYLFYVQLVYHQLEMNVQNH